MLHHACESTHPEPMSQDRPQNLRPQDFHLTDPCFELCRSSSPYYTPHVWQPILNQCPKTHHKTSDPKIFISHIPVLNFARADLHIIPHMCANPSWTNVPRQTTKPQTLRFSSHTSLFWTLPEQISILYPTCVPTHPEPMSQDTPQNLRPQDFHLTDPCFELCRSRSPYYTPHVWQPILNQCPKTDHKTSDPKIFISHELCQNRCRVWAPRSSKLIPWLFVDMTARVKNVKRKQGSCVPQRIEFNPRDPFFNMFD